MSYSQHIVQQSEAYHTTDKARDIHAFLDDCNTMLDKILGWGIPEPHRDQQLTLEQMHVQATRTAVMGVMEKIIANDAILVANLVNEKEQERRARLLRQVPRIYKGE